MLKALSLELNDAEKALLEEAIGSQIRVNGNAIEQATADHDLESAVTWQREIELLPGIADRLR